MRRGFNAPRRLTLGAQQEASAGLEAASAAAEHSPCAALPATPPISAGSQGFSAPRPLAQHNATLVQPSAGAGRPACSMPSGGAGGGAYGLAFPAKSSGGPAGRPCLPPTALKRPAVQPPGQQPASKQPALPSQGRAAAQAGPQPKAGQASVTEVYAVLFTKKELLAKVRLPQSLPGPCFLPSVT
jgi:hypothetical protein